jgi:CRP-like cAMP-binding protein
MSTSLDGKTRVLDRDEILFREGAPADRFFLVASGSVRCLKGDGDRIRQVFLAGPKDVIGEEALFARTPHAYAAVAAEVCAVVEVPLELLDEVMGKAPKWLGELLATLGQRFNATADVVANHLSVPEDLPEAEQVRLKKLLASKIAPGAGD